MDSNSSLDFTSENFDPVLALASKTIVLPYPNVTPYNNLAEYYSRNYLRKNLVAKKNTLTPKDRNYAYYLKTIGISGQRAVRYMERLGQFRKAKKALKKKPKNVTYTPGSPLRSDKVINLESKYHDYWKRKLQLYENASTAPDVDTILKKSEDIPLFQKIKSLAKPVTAQELIVKAKQQASLKPSCVTQVPISRPADGHSFDRKLNASSISDADYNSDSSDEELVRFCGYLSSWIVANPAEEQVNESKDFLCRTNPSSYGMTSTDVNFVSNHVRYVPNYVGYLGNNLTDSVSNSSSCVSKSADYVRNSANYVPNYKNCARNLTNNVSKSADHVINSSKCVSNSIDSVSNSADCDNNSDKKQIDSPLTPKENILEISNEAKVKNNDYIKKMIVLGKNVKRLTPKKVQPSKVTVKKENCKLLINQCTCHPKLTMGSYCTCGVYSTAMKNLQKFKIPKKK